MGLLAPVEAICHCCRRTCSKPTRPYCRANLQAAAPGASPKNRKGASVEYEVNKDYWNADRVSSFDRLSVTLVPEEPQRIALMQTDKIDLSPIGAADIPGAKSNGLVVDGPKHVISTALRFFMSYDEDYFTSSLEFREGARIERRYGSDC